MFDGYEAFAQQHQGMTEEELNRLYPNGLPPMSPLPAVPPGMSVLPPPGGMSLPETWGTPVTPPADTPPGQSPYLNPNAPMQEASMGGGLLDKYAMGLGGGSQGGGGFLSGLFGGGESAPSGGKDWGSMLMALGGGIAQGAQFGGGGWGGGLGRGFQGAALANMRSKENAQEEAYRQQVLAMRQAELNKADKPVTTDDITEWNAAGRPGTLQDWIINTKKASATNVTMNAGDSKLGPISADHYLKMTESGPVMEVVPGSKTDKDQKAAAKAAEDAAKASDEEQATKADVMLGAIGGIKDAVKNSTMPTLGKRGALVAGAPVVGSDTGAAAVRGHVATLKSGVGIEGLQRMKAASANGASGFGALQAAELQLLLDRLGSLDPDGNEAVFNQTIDQIEKQWTSIAERVRKTVPPERLKELGIDPAMFGIGGKGGDKGGVVDYKDYFGGQ
jgi:hypothetical protein